MSALHTDPRIARGMERQNALRRERAAQGMRIVGWKVGFGARAAKERLRLDKPLVGFLTDRALLPSGAAVSVAGWQKPVAEAEIAVYIGRDIPAGADEKTVRGAVAALGPAIELADIDCPMDDVEAILAGDIFQRHVVLGAKDETRQGARLDGLRGRLIRARGPFDAPADLETNTGRIVDIVRHVADTAASVGEMLRAGQFIIAGSVTPPLFLDASDGTLMFELQPIGTVSVKLSGFGD